MNPTFANVLRKIRTEKGFSQQALADKMFVTQSTVARWESGSRLPDAMMTNRLATILGVDVSLLFTAAESDESPNVILVDDMKLILVDGLPVLEEVMPNANVIGFTDAEEAMEYAKNNRVSLAFLDIELRNASGIDLCRDLLAINPRTNVVYLTAYREYSFDAWDTGACGFMLKPITAEAVRTRLGKLRFPFLLGGEEP